MQGQQDIRPDLSDRPSELLGLGFLMCPGWDEQAHLGGRRAGRSRSAASAIPCLTRELDRWHRDLQCREDSFYISRLCNDVTPRTSSMCAQRCVRTCIIFTFRPSAGFDILMREPPDLVIAGKLIREQFPPRGGMAGAVSTRHNSLQNTVASITGCFLLFF